MNLLFIESSIDPSRGGVQRVSYSLYDYFESHGISCYFAYYLVGYDKISEDKKLFFSPDGNKKYLLSIFGEFISKNKIDVVILQGIHNGRLLSVLNSLRNKHHCKLIYCLHQTPDYYKYYKEGFRPKQFIKRLITGKTYMQRAELRAYKIVDKYILLSKSYVPYFKKLFGISESYKLDYLENPLPFKDKGKKYAKDKTVLIVSRFSEVQKNIKSALRIWKKVENVAVEEGWFLEVAGYGDDETMLLEYASALGLKNYKFIGKTNNPLLLYERSSIFVMTSFFEGLPMTILESQSMGCVPIAFNSFKSLPDIIENEVNGFIVPAFDEEKFAYYLLKIMNNEPLRIKMAIAARETSVRFNIQNVGKKWLDLLENIND